MICSISYFGFGGTGRVRIGPLRVVPGDEGKELLDLVEALKFVCGEEMRVAGRLGMDSCAAELLHGDFFPENGA